MIELVSNGLWLGSGKKRVSLIVSYSAGAS
jgi:hypothetical protein